MIEHYDVKSKQLREFEKHLNKKKLALATERKVVAELKEKLERELANLQVNKQPLAALLTNDCAW